MEAFARKLKESDPAANIIHINFNLTEFEPLLEYHALEARIESLYQSSCDNYLLIDEIQMCGRFPDSEMLMDHTTAILNAEGNVAAPWR